MPYLQMRKIITTALTATISPTNARLIARAGDSASSSCLFDFSDIDGDVDVDEVVVDVVVVVEVVDVEVVVNGTIENT